MFALSSLSPAILLVSPQTHPPLIYCKRLDKHALLIDTANFDTPTVAGAERQSARMSKITNDGLTWSGTGCFIAVGYLYGKSGR